ncbi:MAG: RluA family pseudouridine synthase [Treponema sp.]
MNQVSFVFNEAVPTRLDIACAKHLPHLTRSQIKSLNNSVLVNGKKAKMSIKLKHGDEIVFSYNDLKIPSYEAEAIPLNIIYEDENVIVINKKQNMVVHPSNSAISGTLVNALNYYRLNSSPIKDEFSFLLSKDKNSTFKLPHSNDDLLRLGIVHRLDKDTSGLIVTARNIKTQVFLKKQFKKRLVKKTYIAVLEGVPKEKERLITTSIFRSKNGKFIASSNLEKGRIAISKYKVVKVLFGSLSLVKFRIFTGRTHQIRVHAKQIGCPVLGDSIYGRYSSHFSLALHAYKIELDIAHGKHKTFRSKLPLKFKKAILAYQKEHGK